MSFLSDDQPSTISESSSSSSSSCSMSPSPAPSATMMLRSHLTPDSSSDDTCLPTSQVFNGHHLMDDDDEDDVELDDHPSLSLPASDHDAVASAVPSEGAVGPNKRSPETSQPPLKKARQSTKDFVPPDVSGLSKREARLVKNRAAAFLSRQRKREEFENMEVRVAQLEQENARLLAERDAGLRSEIASLRAQLAAAQARERELNVQLTARNSPSPKLPSDTASSYPNNLNDQSPPQVKVEPDEDDDDDEMLPSIVDWSSPLAKGVSLSNSSPHKSNATSFGLMVLLCALPSLLSVPNPTMPTTFSFPSSFPTSTGTSSIDFSALLPNDLDWGAPQPLINSPTTTTSFDSPPFTPPPASPRMSNSHKLEFAPFDSASGLAGLDVSFDASPTPDGKIRVKIHRPSSSSTIPWSSSLAPSPIPHHPHLSTAPDPFLGLPTIADPADINYDINDSLGAEYSVSGHLGGDVRKRVRIALKSPPASGGEGGEWEVELR